VEEEKRELFPRGNRFSSITGNGQVLKEVVNNICGGRKKSPYTKKGKRNTDSMLISEKKKEKEL